MIEFHNERDITDADDAQLRELLFLCFPMLQCFQTSRYWREPCHYRWLIRDNGRIIANASVIDKVFLADAHPVRIAGVAYVCVHPDCRGKGLVKQMLAEIHRWAKDNGYPFAFLFGKTDVYRSSGYIPCVNEFRILNLKSNESEIVRSDSAHYAPLGGEPWPELLMDLQGPLF